MTELSYKRILEENLAEHEACPLRWDCASYTKSLCIRLVAVADLPSLFGTFMVLGFTNNKDGHDHIAVVKGEVHDRSWY